MTAIKGSDFFDDPTRFKQYVEGRRRTDGPNATLEEPVILDLIGDISGTAILDLGCGDAAFGVQLLEAGASRYVGLEASEKMADLAAKNLRTVIAKAVHATIESWDFPPASFDLVVSRLALHYVEDFEAVCRNVYSTLRENGRFVFSTIHPVITSSEKSHKGVRQDWTVDDYFATGPRSVQFLDTQVVQYHRTIEDFFLALQQAGFLIEHLRESRPYPAYFTDMNQYRRRMRIPLFIFFGARKP